MLEGWFYSLQAICFFLLLSLQLFRATVIGALRFWPYAFSAEDTWWLIRASNDIDKDEVLVLEAMLDASLIWILLLHFKFEWSDGILLYAPLTMMMSFNAPGLQLCAWTFVTWIAHTIISLVIYFYWRENLLGRLYLAFLAVKNWSIGAGAGRFR